MTPVPSREKLVREGVRLMSERGYRETTVGDIEEAAGLTRRAGGFYRHFKSKEDLLVEVIARMAGEMISEIAIEEVTSLRSIRAELLVIARALVRHAGKYRTMRLLFQREAHKLPKLRAAAKRANRKLAAMDVVPWVESALARSGRKMKGARQTALLIFAPVLLHIVAQDRGDRVFGIGNPEDFLLLWCDHWARWFEGSSKA
jgi:AcrR family transcriptional regulator